MSKRIIIFIILFAIVHFIFSIISVLNGMTIFSGPKTNTEIFLSYLMNILLFPLNILLRNVSFVNLWAQTIIIFLNSLISGGLFSIIYFLIIKSKLARNVEGN